MQCAHQGAARHGNLEGVAARPFALRAGAVQQERGGLGKRTGGAVAAGLLADQQRFGLGTAPGLVRHAAQRHARGAHAPALVQVQQGRGRHQRKRIGRTLAHLDVHRMAGKALRGWQRDVLDQLVGLQRGVLLGVVAGQAVQVGKGNGAGAARRAHLHHRFQRGQRHAQVGRVRGNAVFAGAQDGVLARQGSTRRAAAAGLALVARHAHVVEVHAARALQQVAAVGGQVADLRRRAGQQRRRDQRVLGAHQRVVGGVGIARQCAQAQAAVRRGLDGVQARQAVDVHQPRRAQHVFLHQVEQVGAAGNEAAAAVGAGAAGVNAQLRQGVGAVAGAGVGERGHAGTVPATTAVCAASPDVPGAGACPSATWQTACTICG